MLKHRIIPVLLYDGSYCVQTTQFGSVRRLGPMGQYVNNMAKRDVDELVILDIMATKEGRGPKFSNVRNFVGEQFSPISYGGGIRSLGDINGLIKSCGVDKVIIKSAMPFLIEQAARKFGSQAMVYALDCEYYDYFGRMIVHGNKIPNLYPRDIAKEMEDRGVGEILLTDIDQQGRMKGYNLDLIDDISNAVNIPVIANGGCGDPYHMVEAIQAGASAVAASSMFALRGDTPQGCARALRAAGLPARVAQPPPE